MKFIYLFYGCGALLLSTVAAWATDTSPATDIKKSTQERRKDGALKVYSSRDGRLIDEIAFIEALAEAPLVLLGEVHDNPIHHRLRAQIVSKLIASRLKMNLDAVPPAAVFEHATTDRQPHFSALTVRNTALATKNGSRPVDQIGEFFKASDWKSRGWPSSELFTPLVSAVLNAQMPLFAGDVPHQRMMRVARGSSTRQSAAISQAEIEHLKLDKSLGTANNSAALTEIAEAHCGVLPELMLGPMAYAQRLRDATLADVMLNAVTKHGAAVLFAGNGHVRTDRGVPWYLRARTKQPVLSVMFKERPSNLKGEHSPNPDHQAGNAEPPMASEQAESTPTADYIIWTAPHTRPDPCRKLREKYGKTKR